MSARYNRFNDPAPFTPLSKLSPESQEWHLKVIDAKQHFAQTDDPTELIELGVFPKDYAERRAREQNPASEDETADKEVRMELEQATIDEIKLQARNGKTIAQIGKDLKVDYWEVWQHAERSWQGTKWIITNRLNLLAKENNPETRDRLKKEADECVDYLFDQGKRMGRQIDGARKALNQ